MSACYQSVLFDFAFLLCITYKDNEAGISILHKLTVWPIKQSQLDTIIDVKYSTLTQRANATVVFFFSVAHVLFTIWPKYILNKMLAYPSITWNFSFYHKLQIVKNQSILQGQCVCWRRKCMRPCRYAACDMYSYTRKRSFVNFKRLKFMGHPNAFEQRCVIRCMFGWNSEDRWAVARKWYAIDWWWAKIGFLQNSLDWI